jgi:ribosome-binding ATPase
MGISIGIVGLPNVGKSTTFNALTKEQNAAVANYPFCTIKPNRAFVPVPDDRILRLAELADREKIIQATVEFVDIAGLVKGASNGEGLGNQFLGNIRNTTAIVHVVRCYEDSSIVHISEVLDPQADIEIVNTELMLADLQQVQNVIERLSRQVKGDRKLLPRLNMAEAIIEHLDNGNPVRLFPERGSEEFQSLNKDLQFLTDKPVIFVANVDEQGLLIDGQHSLTVKAIASEQNADYVKLCGRLEEETAGMTESERREFLEVAGAEETALAQVIRKSYDALGLISFFTMNEEEVRAWTIPDGLNAQKSAGVIHTDFERGFIRADVIPFHKFEQYGSFSAIKTAGELQLEGKDYIVQDGDLIQFRFNV